MGRTEPLAGTEKRCPLCGKEFWAGSEWVFRKTDRKTGYIKYYCSWGCIRKLEKEGGGRRYGYTERDVPDNPEG